MELDFVDNSGNEEDSTVRVVDVSVHQGQIGVTSAILVLEQASTMNTMVPAPQCATVLTCVPLPLQGPTVCVLLLAQSASVAAPMLLPGTVLPSGNRALITMQGPAFLPMASVPMWFLGVPAVPAPMQSAGAPLQSADMPPMAGAPWLIRLANVYA